MAIESFDHVAVPTRDAQAMIDFYRQLGFTVVGEDAWRDGTQPFVSVALDQVKINLHDPKLWQDERFTLRGPTAVPGCADLCFTWSGPIDEAVALVEKAGGPLVKGPVTRVGGRDRGSGEGRSVYTRDPDGNLLEFIAYNP